jgi:hypothetical protein
LVKVIGGLGPDDAFPTQLTLRRALLPKHLPPEAVEALKQGVVPIKLRDKS